MRRRDPVLWQQVVEDLANALQVAIGRAALVRCNAETTTEEAALLEASIGRAVSALKRLQTRSKSGTRRR